MNQKSILMVEDEPSLIDLYRGKFEREGFRIFVAETAKRGLDLISQEKIDLVLLDILLPEENGLYFLTVIRSDKNFSEMPVIVFSNYRNAKMEQTAFRLGISGYITKADFDPSEIVSKVKKVLGMA